MLADSLSRQDQVLGSGWTLVQKWSTSWGVLWPVMVDLFATSITCHLPIFSFPSLTPWQRERMLFSIPGTGSRHFAFPPFARAVAGQLSWCHHGSSRRLYQHCWECFRRWCADRGHPASTLSVSKIANFLFFLHSTTSFHCFGQGLLCDALLRYQVCPSRT